MKRLRNVMINWGVIYVLITALIYALNQWLVTYPIYLRTLALSGVMVFVMQYMISPFLEKLLKNK